MEKRLIEIQECRAEVQELTRRVNALSERIEKLAAGQPTAVETQRTVPAVRYTPPVQQPAAAVPSEKDDGSKRYQNLENTVGKNLFAILASVLVLLGVGVFISTIYEQIPEFVKILAIYIFGFAVLGCGLVLYRKNKNNFWLGVASCGLAELLVSVITSHSYFEVLSLGATFVLILIWIIGSFALTRIQPTVFKTIGYIGFTISMILGLNLLSVQDLPIYLTLVAAFGILSVFFMVTNSSHVKMNTVLAFANVLNLCQFFGMRYYLPEGFDWVSGLIAGGILAVFHGVYLFRAKLSRDAYPFFCIVTIWVLSAYTAIYETAVNVPLYLCLIFLMWYGGYKLAAHRVAGLCYGLFAALYLWGMAYYAAFEPIELFLWFAAFAAVAYVLYFVTRKRDIAWLGLVCFAAFYVFAGRRQDMVLFWTLASALVFFVLNSSKVLRKDSALQTAWYVLIFCIAHSVKYALQSNLYQSGQNAWELEQISSGIFYAAWAFINTAYLHFALQDREKVMRITKKGIVLMALQCILLANCLAAVDSRIWFVTLLGVAASLVIVSYSLRYSYKTSGANKKLMVWQFVKFSLYCWLILAILDSPDILVNISLLLIAILAVILGFRLGHKSVRVYGLVLSLLDVISLVLFNIDFSDSLQLAGGIVLCGALCFVISFIYSKLSKSARLTKPEPERMESAGGKDL